MTDRAAQGDAAYYIGYLSELAADLAANGRGDQTLRRIVRWIAEQYDLADSLADWLGENEAQL